MKEAGKSSRRHSIGVISRLTGLKPDVIRAWERRYGAIEPSRTATNRRYYTDGQLERLVLLRRATLAGRQIGQIANLDTEELRELVAKDEAIMGQVPRAAPSSAPALAASPQLAACMAAVENLDAQALQLRLEQSTVELSQPRLMETVLTPLLEQIGEAWEKGTFRVAHEHLASAVIRSCLANLQGAFVPGDTAPAIVIGTPSRQLHEMGALMVATTAASEGWRVHYLGVGLPVEEIAAVAVQKAADVVALSIVYPNDDPYLGSEITRLRRLLGDHIVLLVGGRAARNYSRFFREISAKEISDLNELRSELRRQRSLHPT